MFSNNFSQCEILEKIVGCKNKKVGVNHKMGQASGIKPHITIKVYLILILLEFSKHSFKSSKKT